MTIGMWLMIVFGVIVLFGGIALGVFSIVDGEPGGGIAVILIGGVIGLCMIVGTLIYRNTEAGERSLKDYHSNFNGGITRTVKVYDINGDLITSYEGKFDIETDKTSYILFDDDNGKRHIIYYTTGTVVIDEN